jgi:hypothetical protein
VAAGHALQGHAALLEMQQLIVPMKATDELTQTTRYTGHDDAFLH